LRTEMPVVSSDSAINFIPLYFLGWLLAENLLKTF
jgi:hypothetical protein